MSRVDKVFKDCKGGRIGLIQVFSSGRCRLDRADREPLLDKINNLPPVLEIVITKVKGNKKPNSTPILKKKGKAKCQDCRTSSLKQALQDKVAHRSKGLKLDTESHKQDLPSTIPAPKSVTLSNSDEKYRIENVGTSDVSSSNTLTGTTGQKKQKMKTSESESSAPVMRVVNNCTDLASDPTMQPGGCKTFSQARPSTRCC